jgi:hypothetical protein
MGDSHHLRMDSLGTRRKRGDEAADGSPWQAMKRLRVAEDRSVVEQSTGWGQPTPVSSHDIVHAGLAQDYRDSDYRERFQQDAGQDTMSEGWDMESPQRLTPMKQSSPVASYGDDVDYHSVNHILGALHLSRRQREEQRAPLQPQPDYLMSQASSMSQSPLGAPTSPPATSRWHNERSYSTPPPKPAKRKVVRLATNSKLG